MLLKPPFQVNPYFSLGIATLVIGFSAIFIRQAEAPGTMAGFYRMAIGLLVMTLPFFWHIRTQKDRLPKQGIIIALVGGVFFALDLSLLVNRSCDWWCNDPYLDG